MKKYFSVFALWARCSVYKVFLLILFLGAFQISFSYITIMRSVSSFNPKYSNFLTLENIFGSAVLYSAFAIGILILTIILSLPGTQFSTQTQYTLKRLRIGEKKTFVCQAIYNVIAYLIFWASQILISYIICLIYVKVAPKEYISNQSVFLAYYRSDFLHTLLPLEEILIWIRNFVNFAALGICAATFSYIQRRGKFAVLPVAFSFYTVLFWRQGIGEITSTVTVIASVCVLIIEFFSVFGEKVSYDK